MYLFPDRSIDITMLNFLAILSLLAQVAVSETVYGTAIFSRHGDRTWKGAPPTRLTTVGQIQLFNSGSYWRSRYLDANSTHQISSVSKDTYKAAQISAAAPDQPILKTSGQAFLQGLYPPVVAFETLANGSSIEAPLSGFQYVPLTTVSEDSSETIWLKGDDGCPAYTSASSGWKTTAEVKALTESTKDFYLSFYDDIFAGVLSKSQVDYTNAYTVFDYINVGVVHNSTIAKLVSDEQLFQLQTLADSAEWAQNGAVNSSTDVIAVSGKTLSNRILEQLSAVVTAKGTKGQLSINIGSYDTFLAFFGITGLPKIDANFSGLPDYASVLAFELFSDAETFPEEKDLKVRFLFRNGTDSEAKQFRLFGDNNDMSWDSFKTGMESVALASVKDWCTYCGSTEDYCLLADPSTAVKSVSGKSGLTPTNAGVLGAMVTLGVCLIVAVVALAAGLRVTKRSKVAVVAGGKAFDKGSVSSV